MTSPNEDRRTGRLAATLLTALLATLSGGAGDNASSEEKVKVDQVTPIDTDRTANPWRITSPVLVPPDSTWEFTVISQTPFATHVHILMPSLDSLILKQRLKDSARTVQVSVAYTTEEDAGRFKLAVDGQLKHLGGKGDKRSSPPVWLAKENAGNLPEAGTGGPLEAVGFAVTAEVSGSPAARYRSTQGGAMGVDLAGELELKSSRPKGKSSKAAGSGPKNRLSLHGSVKLVNGRLSFPGGLDVVVPREALDPNGGAVASVVSLAKK